MKLLATALFTGMLAFGTVACAKEEPKKATTVTAPAAPAAPAVADVKKDEAPKTKRVCVMQKDAKTQKEKEVCKEIKIHKKYEGTKPEDVKKADQKK